MPAAEKESESKKKKHALSCAECRRLKLKCDRVFPCSSCKKRGCSAICPNGALTTGKMGGRFILANTEELHEKISDLQARILALEDALALSHGAQSSTVHPLLKPELLSIKMPMGTEFTTRENIAKSENSPISPKEDVLESFGTLTISEGGVSTFYGSTVGSEFLFEDDEENARHSPPTLGNKPQEINWLSEGLSHLAHTFPFATLATDVESVKYELRQHLPPIQVAWHLVNSYFAHAAWMYNPLHRQSFYSDIFTPLYDLSQTKPITSHAISVAYSVMALGALVDLDRVPYDTEAEKLHLLSRAALAVESCLEVTTINAVQSLVLMAYFNQMTDKKHGPALTWTFNGLAVKLAQSIGLHRDWEKWGLPIEEVAIRRTVMWECITFDSWSSFGFGRPPSQAMHFVDCKQTPDPQKADEPCESFAPLKYKFTEILLEVVNVSFGAIPPSYDEIMKLDRRLRDYYIPPLFQVPGYTQDEQPRPPLPANPPLGLALQSHSLAMLRENVLLYMHRSFFAKALSEHPDDPFKSRYAVSVLACHRSACAVIVLVRKLHFIEPRLILRFWYYWVHSFTAAVVLASIVTKTPQSNLAQSSMSHLDQACELFKAVGEGSRPASTLPILLKIRQKARDTYMGVNKDTHDPAKEGQGLESMLSGQTRLVTRRAKSDPPPARDEEMRVQALGDVHPSLVDHLRSFYVPQPVYYGDHHTPSSSNPTPPMPVATSFSVPPSESYGSLPPSASDDVHPWHMNQPSLHSQPSASSLHDVANLPPQDQHMAHHSMSAPSQQPWEMQQQQPPAYPLSTMQGPDLMSEFFPSHASTSYGEPGPSHSQLPYPLRAEGVVWDQNSRSQQASSSKSATHADPAGGLMHAGGVGSLEQSWRSFLSGVDFPTSPVPMYQQPLP